MGFFFFFFLSSLVFQLSYRVASLEVESLMVIVLSGRVWVTGFNPINNWVRFVLDPFT
jgi:hypothetical protein